MFYFFLHKNLHFVPPLMGGGLKCVLRGGERGEKKSGVLIGVEKHTTSPTCRSRAPNKMVVTQVQNAASTRTVVINIEEPMPLCLIYDLYFLSRILLSE